jgi:2-phosphoglycerate kinase
MARAEDATTDERDHLRGRLRHVRWIGGGSLAGKSTVAHRLAEEHGLRVVSTDASMAEHARRSNPEDAPLLHAFMAMDMDERWLDRTPQVMLATFPWFRGEVFDQIVDDLVRFPADQRVIVEGFRLLPRCVAPLLTEDHRAVWLLPTPEHRDAAARRRGAGWEFLDRTSDPPQARRNLLERDRLFTEQIREEARHLDLRTIDMDGTTEEEELTARVAAALGL